MVLNQNNGQGFPLPFATENSLWYHLFEFDVALGTSNP